MKRNPWCFALVAATVSGLVASACSTTITEPPPLGDCIPTGDAACKLSAGGGGGGSPSGGHGDSGELESSITVTADGGSCGEADMLVSSSTQNPGCLPCIVSPDSGALCCMSDAVCSRDPGCLAIVQCALTTCSGNAACVGTTCEQGPTATPLSVTYYNDFGSCLALNCSPECPTLPQGTAGDL